MSLGEHPFILAARLVWEYSGQLFVEMEWIASDAMGRVTLADHLSAAQGPLGLNVALSWAIQFCHGIEHATRHGIASHQDIKPANILVVEHQCEGRERAGTVKITDFGLAVAGQVLKAHGGLFFGGRKKERTFGLSVIQNDERVICGTPGYIAPELVMGKRADSRSDIYSFGVVLWQMAMGSAVSPFHVSDADDVEDYQRRIFQRQISQQILPADGPLNPIILRCLQPDPNSRYADFQEVRRNLEAIYEKRTDQTFLLPTATDDSAESWCNRGSSLSQLGRHEEALAAFSKALKLDPVASALWSNMGLVLRILGRNEESLSYLSKAIEIDPKNASAYTNKGSTLGVMGRHEDALAYHSKAIEIDPKSVHGWINRGNALADLNRFEEAIYSYSEAIQRDPGNSMAWANKGNALKKLGRTEEAAAAYSMTLEIDPMHAGALHSLGDIFFEQKRFENAVACYSKGLELDPRSAVSWNNQGIALTALGRFKDAIISHAKAIEIAPNFPSAYLSKAAAHDAVGDKRATAACFRRFLDLTRHDPSQKEWVSKVEVLLSRLEGRQ